MNFRVATYNIHRCVGLDRKCRPERVLSVLRQIDADIVALQEVVNVQDGNPLNDQARFICEELGFCKVDGWNTPLYGGRYGNVILSRFPIVAERNHDLSVTGRQPRGCLRADVRLNGRVLHVFNAHLGTSMRERRHQARRLAGADVINHPELARERVLLGDFNDWTRLTVVPTLISHLASADIRRHLRRRSTYPGLLPLLHLDHIYHDPCLKIRKMELHRTREARIASDHLPLVADFAASA